MNIYHFGALTQCFGSFESEQPELGFDVVFVSK